MTPSWGAGLVTAGTALSVASLALTVDNLRRVRVPEVERPTDAQPDEVAALRQEVDHLRDALERATGG